MRAKILIFFSFFALLIFPQYAFSIESGSATVNGTSSSTNATTTTPTTTNSTQSTSTTTTTTTNPTTTSNSTQSSSSQSSTNNTSTTTTTPTTNSTQSSSSQSSTNHTSTTSSSTSTTQSTNAVFVSSTSSANTQTHTDTSSASTQTQTSQPVTTLVSSTTTVSPNFVTVNQGSEVIFTATVSDNSNVSANPAGMVSWKDGNAGGKFSTDSCIVSSSGNCKIKYTLGVNAPGSITITATYGGDGTHSSSGGISSLSVNQLHDTTTTVTPTASTINQGSQVTLVVSVNDTSNSPTNPSGTISWSDANTGGTFSSASCTLSSGSCYVSYTTAANSPSSVTISASYAGDSTHSASSGKTQLSINEISTSLQLTSDQSYYAFGDVVTLSVNLPDTSLQNVAVGVTNPAGDNIISRTITTNENGTGSFQFKIPSNYQTGAYQDVATVVVGGKEYTSSGQFSVITTHGISIESVQITNQQGDPVSLLKKGQNGYLTVSLSSGETMPALLALNLFDAKQSSLGTATIKSVVNSGKSQLTLSFFIPSSAQVGLANVYADAYTDWPSNGGTPLTAETCLASDLQDPTTLSASYVPNPPHSCTSIMPNPVPSGSGEAQNVVMTNSQAKVTLGVAIFNDSMTFMSPAQAHLLALAYDKGTSKGNSVALVSLNLNNMSSTDTTVHTTGNVTKIGPAAFTTIAGPDIANNPMAQKILQEIEVSKRQVANILGNETAKKLNDQLVLQQRQAAAEKLKADLDALAQANISTTPEVAFTSFLTTVPETGSQQVFLGQYNFMQQRVSAANSAMQNVLNSGGSLAQAILTFNKYATVNHAQLVSLNNALNVAYGLADSRIQSCFDSKGNLPTVNGVNPCIVNIENNSTGPSGISILSVQPTDQGGNPVSLLKRGQTGYVKVVVMSSLSTPSLVTMNIFDSNISSLGTVSAKYTLNPGRSEVVLPYYIPAESQTGLASIYANVFTDWPHKQGVSQSNELSYFVGLA